MHRPPNGATNPMRALLLLLALATVANAIIVTIRVDGNRERAGSAVVHVTANGIRYASVAPGASDTVALDDGSYQLRSDNGPAEAENTPVPLNVTVIVSVLCLRPRSNQFVC